MNEIVYYRVESSVTHHFTPGGQEVETHRVRYSQSDGPTGRHEVEARRVLYPQSDGMHASPEPKEPAKEVET